MKHFFFFTIFFFALFVNAQESKIDHTLNTYQKINRGMTVLSTWAASNMIIGATQIGSDQWYYHRANMLWNTVNLGLGIVGLYQSKSLKEITDTDDLIKRQRKFEKTFIINSGLDLVYMAGGLVLQNNSDQELAQTGSSLILQGGFLLLFDTLMYFTIRKERTNTLKSVPQFGLSLVEMKPGFSFSLSF